MTRLLEDQVAIITGSGRGIGAATGKLFAEHGAKVVVSDRDAEPAEEVVAAITKAGGDAIAVPGDITDVAFPDALVKTAVDTYGKLHILVNNAGYTWDGVVHKMTDEQWQAILEIHCTAPFRMIRAAAPYMRDVAKADKNAGREPEPRCIVNISSTAGTSGNAGQVNYSTAKMGVLGMTKTIAKEWGRFGIRCNAVVFGFIETRLTRPKEEGGTVKAGDQDVAVGVPGEILAFVPMVTALGRAGQTEEAAAGILIMAAPIASYITGHILEVTGGLSL
jgi:3-oxoacyl-[acyl-carrier protein] reductase